MKTHLWLSNICLHLWRKAKWYQLLLNWHFFLNQRSRNSIETIKSLAWGDCFELGSEVAANFLKRFHIPAIDHSDFREMVLDPFKTACNGTAFGANFTFKLQSHFSWWLHFKMVSLKSVGYFLFYGKALWIGSFLHFFKKHHIKSMNSTDRVIPRNRFPSILHSDLFLFL